MVFPQHFSPLPRPKEEMPNQPGWWYVCLSGFKDKPHRASWPCVGRVICMRPCLNSPWFFYSKDASRMCFDSDMFLRPGRTRCLFWPSMGKSGRFVPRFGWPGARNWRSFVTLFIWRPSKQVGTKTGHRKQWGSSSSPSPSSLIVIVFLIFAG